MGSGKAHLGGEVMKCALILCAVLFSSGLRARDNCPLLLGDLSQAASNMERVDWENTLSVREILWEHAQMSGRRIYEILKLNPHHRNFLSSIGFQSYTEGVVSLENLENAVDQTVEGWIREGRISPDEVIRLGALVGKGKKDRRLVTMADQRDRGLTHNRHDFYTIHEQIMYAARGFWTVGTARYFVHDLGHISALLRHPEFMRAWRILSQRYASGDFKNLRNAVERSYSIGSQIIRQFPLIRTFANKEARQFKNRYLYVTEWLVLFEEGTPLHEFLDLPLDKVSLEENLEQIDGLIRASSDEQIKAMAKKMMALYDGHAIQWGGAANDAHNPIKFGNRNGRTVDYISPAVHIETLRQWKNRKTLKELYKWALIAKDHNKPEDWLEWAFDPSSQPELSEVIRHLDPGDKYFGRN